jgi:hypothetical protein
MNESRFPPGTQVCVRQRIEHRDRPIEAEVSGVVESWEDLPTGSWYAHGKRAGAERVYGRLWLNRLTLRKPDGEITTLVINSASEVVKIEPASANEEQR